MSRQADHSDSHEADELATLNLVCLLVFDASSMGLTRVGYFWVLMSMVASACVVAGFYIPRWVIGSLTIEGRRYDAFFSCFRRCNYPVVDKSPTGYHIEEGCGRYRTLDDIPSFYWQVATISGFSGCALSIVVVFVLIPACCIREMVTKPIALLLGLTQVIAAVSIIAAFVVFPLGWYVMEIKEACGASADQFMLGNCTVGWSYTLMPIGSGLLLFCAAISVKGGRNDNWVPSIGRRPSRCSYDEQALMHPFSGANADFIGAIPA